MEHLTASTPHRGLRLQPRDLAILGDLGEVVMLDTATIHARYFPSDKSGQACRRRLRFFNVHGLTQAISVSVARTAKPGRLPTIHRLTVIGADVVEHETGVRPQRVGRSDPPKPHTLLHRLGMARVILSVNDACRLHQLERPQWILEYDAIPGVPPHAPFSKRFKICHEFRDGRGKKHLCWPDAACVLTVPKDGKLWRLGMLWEYDRSTETLSQVAEKLVGYEQLLTTHAYRRYWGGVSGVRVFFVVPSAARQQNIAAALRKHATASAVRIAPRVQAEQPSTVLAATIWLTPAGEEKSILT